MSKLTLSVDDAVVVQAKRYAATRGTSVSQLVERYLALLGRPPRSAQATPPILARVRGALKGSKSDVRDYRRHLERKYR